MCARQRLAEVAGPLTRCLPNRTTTHTAKNNVHTSAGACQTDVPSSVVGAVRAGDGSGAVLLLPLEGTTTKPTQPVATLTQDQVVEGSFPSTTTSKRALAGGKRRSKAKGQTSFSCDPVHRERFYCRRWIQQQLVPWRQRLPYWPMLHNLRRSQGVVLLHEATLQLR